MIQCNAVSSYNAILKDSDDFDFLPSDRWSYLTESFQFLGEPFEILQTCIISELYFTILGSLSLGTEAMLAAPQFLKNYRSGSTTGMSIFMVLGWLCGDLFKVIYFYLFSQPLRFLVCGIIQVSIDFPIVDC